MPIRKGPIPKTGGILTFIGAPRGSIDNLGPGMVGVLGVPFDVSATDKLGTRTGPQAYRETSTYFWNHTDPDSSLIEIDSRVRVDTELMKNMVRDLGDLSVSHVDWSVTESRLRDAARRITLQAAIPVILGGDHFITYPLVQGYADAIKERSGGNIGYIQFSGRLDLGRQDPLWGEVWRGATARRIIDTGAVGPENMVWVGVNGYVPLEDWELSRKLPATVFTAEDVRERGIGEIASRALEIAGRGCDGVYVSVDIDVLDGGYVAMTGAPRFDGLKNVDMFAAMDVLARGPVGAIDICGLNPLVEVMGLGKTGQRFGVDMLLRFIEPKISKEGASGVTPRHGS